MEQRDIISMLNYPDRPLVDYALSLANLTLPEQEAITMRVYNGETVESAAERCPAPITIPGMGTVTLTINDVDMLYNCIMHG